MTKLNQNQMNTNQRSKAPLVLFIVCILVLIIVGGYFAYAKSLNKPNQNKAQSNQEVEITSMNNRVNVINKSDLDQQNLSEKENCDYTVSIPVSWIRTDDPKYWNYFLNTKKSQKVVAYLTKIHKNALDEATETQSGLEAFPDIVISCYQKEPDYISDFWMTSDKYSDSLPATIEETVTKIFTMKQNKQNDEVQAWLNSFISTERITIGKNKFTMIEYGGFGQTCTAIIKNNQGEVLSIYIDAGSDKCQQLPQEQTKILSSLTFN